MKTFNKKMRRHLRTEVSEETKSMLYCVIYLIGGGGANFLEKLGKICYIKEGN